MSKAKTEVKKQNRIDLEKLSQKDFDILNLATSDVMKKYKLEKQGVYDRRFALNKKIKAAGLTVDLLAINNVSEQVQKKAQPKKMRSKKTQPEKTHPIQEEKSSGSREVMAINKQVPAIMKPIEINFGHFSVKLNGVPKSMSVNPDTNAIEIDL